MKSKTPIILLLLIFTFSVSSGAAMLCCWEMDENTQHTDHVKSDEEHAPCHSKSEKSNKDSKKSSEESNDCCYDMIECQVQVIKITKSVSISPSTYTLIQHDLVNNFISNTIEPLKHPPKVLL